MNDKFNAESLAELQNKNLPVFDASKCLEGDGSEDSKSALAQAQDYFNAFVQQVPGGECICCGQMQGGKDIIDALLGRAKFKWGLAHGEGFCSNCGYPGRAHHEIPGVGRITNLILQYHPSGLSFKPKHTEESLSQK